VKIAHEGNPLNSDLAAVSKLKPGISTHLVERGGKREVIGDDDPLVVVAPSHEARAKEGAQELLRFRDS